MAPIKSLLRKYEVPIVILITLLCIYTFVFFSQKINFFLGNELIIHLSPSHSSFSMHYGDAGKIDFNVSIENVAYCKAKCSYEFVDRSKNNLIDKNDFKISIGSQFSRSYNLSVKRLGSGQDLYSFEVRCKSLKSVFCHTEGREKSRNALITVNYDLTKAEKELKNNLRQNVSRFLQYLTDADIEHQKTSQKYFELGKKADLNNITPIKIEIDGIYDELAISAENLRSIWSFEDYNKLNKLFSQSYFDNAQKLGRSIRQLDIRIDEIVAAHNKFIDGLNALYQENYKLDKYAQALEDEEMLYDAFAARRVIDKITASLLNNTFDDYDEIKALIFNATKQHNELAVKLINHSARMFFVLGYSIKKDNDVLCSLKGACNFTVSDILLDTEEFLNKYPDIGLENYCSSINDLELRYGNANDDALLEISSRNIDFDESAANISREFMENELRKLNNSYLDSYEKSLEENKSDREALAIAHGFLPKEKANIADLKYNQSINISLYSLSTINVSKNLIGPRRKCELMTQSLRPPSVEHINTAINYTVTNRINTNLSDNLPVCCVFSECNPCCNGESCRNDPRTYPIIFLHGHAFSKDNSPEYSLDAFNKMQDKLQEDGYLSAGIISLYSVNEAAEPGIWSLSGRPITVKASYYYDAFRKYDKYIVVPTKSESIDAYALRLKDVVEIVKQRTGKPQVNIIAHSMGGLVARRYSQIFEDNDIDKLILIAVPNHGITGSAANYCGIIGENRECRDMMKDSLFINKLNDPLKQPNGTKLYNIIGKGCLTDSKDSDGVVEVESAHLANAESYFVDGTCSGFFEETLHTSMLNVDKYPQTYRIVKEILKE